MRNVCGHKNDEEYDAGNAVVPEDEHRANLLNQNASEDSAAKFAESMIQTLEEGLRRGAEVGLGVVRDERAGSSPYCGVGNALEVVVREYTWDGRGINDQYTHYGV